MRYLPSLLRVQILSNDGICLGANMNKFDQMWYLLHICIDFAVVVNPFFRAVPDNSNLQCMELEPIIIFTLKNRDIEGSY